MTGLHLLLLPWVARLESALAQSPIPAGTGGRTSMMAESPFTDYTAAAVAYTIVIGALVVLLIAGGLLVVNLALASKRKIDHIGGRTPSDLGILRDNIWPPEDSFRPVLPAEESEAEPVVEIVANAEGSDCGAKPAA